MANDSQIRIGMDLDTSGIERSTARAEKAVEQLRSRTESRMGSGGSAAGGAWGAGAADAISRRAPMIFAATSSLGRVASAALSSSGGEKMARYLDGAVQGSVQLGAALAPLGPAAMAVGATFGAAGGALATYFRQAKTAREETEKLAEAAEKAAAARQKATAEALAGRSDAIYDRRTALSAGDATGAQSKIDALRKEESRLQSRIDSGLTGDGEKASLGRAQFQIREWENTLQEIKRRASPKTDKEFESAKAFVSSPTLDDDAKYRVGLVGAVDRDARIALMERRAEALTKSFREATETIDLSGESRKLALKIQDELRAIIEQIAVERATEAKSLYDDQRNANKNATRKVLPSLVRPGSVDAMQSKGWGAVSEPWAGLKGLAGAQAAAGSIGGPNTLESLAREQRDLLRRIAESLRPGQIAAPTAVYAK